MPRYKRPALRQREIEKLCRERKKNSVRLVDCDVEFLPGVRPWRKLVVDTNVTDIWLEDSGFASSNALEQDHLHDEALKHALELFCKVIANRVSKAG